MVGHGNTYKPHNAIHVRKGGIKYSKEAETSGATDKKALAKEVLQQMPLSKYN